MFLLAKVAASTIVLLLITTLALILARWGLFIPLANIPLAILWAALSGIFMLFFFTTLQMMASSQRGGNMMTSAFLFPLVMIGGAFFPFEAMPDWMAAVGQYTPNGWALQRLKQIILQDFQIGSLLGGFLLMGVVVSAAFLVIAWRLRRGFAQS